MGVEFDQRFRKVQTDEQDVAVTLPPIRHRLRPDAVDFHVTSDDVQVSVDAGTVWSGDDVYAGTLSIDVGFGSLTAEATAAGGQNLSVDLSWTGSSL